MESTIDSQLVDLRPTPESLSAILKQLSQKAGSIGRFASLIPGTANYIGSLNRALFMMVSEQIVCVDDLERAGSGLDIKNVLGLIANLKDEKLCKIVIVMNQDALSSSDHKSFQEQIEKVADTVMSFTPTSAEAVSLALDTKFSLHDLLTISLRALSIVNIRVMRKAEFFCQQSYETLKDLDKRVVEQAVQTISLATFSKFQSDIAPSLNLVKTFNSVSDYMRSQNNKEVDPDASHKKMLRLYGFTSADDFDLALIDGVEQSFFDEDILRNEAIKLHDTLLRSDKHDSLRKAWSLFSGSFDDNETLVLSSIVTGLRENLQVVNAQDLSSVVSLLKELGHSTDALEMIQFYIENHVAAPSFWDLSNHSVGNEFTDPDLRNAFARKLATLKETSTPLEVLQKISDQNGWSQEDMTRLAEVKESEYITMFKSIKDDELRRVIKTSLQFRNISNADENMQKVTSGTNLTEGTL